MADQIGNNFNWKNFYTVEFLKKLNLPIDELTIAQHKLKWWAIPRNKGKYGLRLSLSGFEIFNKFEVQSYDIRYTTPLTLIDLIKLDNIIEMPYFLTKEKLHTTNSKVFTELTLYSNNLKRYIDVKSK